jgi:hypothetical protein
LESIAETPPQLQPTLGIVDHLRRRFARFKLGAHFLQAHSESFNLLLLLGFCYFLLFNHRFQLRNCRSLLLGEISSKLDAVKLQAFCKVYRHFFLIPK